MQTDGHSSAVEANTGPTAISRRSPLIFYLITLLGCLVFLVLGFHREPRVFHSRDFKQPYASARCLLEHCNPYSESDTEAQYAAARGPNNDQLVFVPYSALYPPPSLLLLAPVAALPYPAAHFVWLLLIAAGFCTAAMLVANLCAPYGSFVAVIALACFVAGSDVLLMLGQLSGVAIALLVIGIWALLREKVAVAVVCITLALCLKPHDVLLFVPYLLMGGRKWRRGFWGIVALTAVITLVAVLWFSTAPNTAHWLSDLRVNLAGNSAPGSVNDPGPSNARADAIADLQAVYSVLRDSKPFYSAAAYGTTAILYLAWLYPAMRMRNTVEKHLLAVAGLACITLLPIYHRQYDTRLLLLIFPAIALLLAPRRGVGILAPRRGLGILALLLALAAIFPQVAEVAERILGHGASVATAAGKLRFLLAYRVMELLNLGLAILFVAVFVSEARRERTTQ